MEKKTKIETKEKSKLSLEKRVKQKLKVGMEFKNYTHICNELKEKVKSSNSKNKQLREWSGYFNFENDGHKFIIKKVYEKPKIEFLGDKRGGKVTHGMSYTKIYGVWCGMRERCCNQNIKQYKDYGGRGISICQEWIDKEKGFMNFYEWAIENGYKEDNGLSIDRIDVNGNYQPSNCRWTTQKIQTWNRRNTQYISLFNKSFMTKPDLVEYLNFLEKIVNELGEGKQIADYKEELKIKKKYTNDVELEDFKCE